MRLDALGELGQLADEPVPPGDLERHPGDLPWPLRRGQRPVDPADLEHEDPGRTELRRPADRDGVHDPAVEVVLVAHLGRRQQTRYGGTRDDRRHEWSGREPVLRGTLYRRCTHLELDRQLLEGEVTELLLEPVSHRLVGEDVGAGGDGSSYVLQRLRRIHLARLPGGRPQPDQPFDDREARIPGDHRPVERTDAGAEHQVWSDVAFEQGLQHAHLDRSEHAATAQHERGLLHALGHVVTLAADELRMLGARALHHAMLDPEDQDRDHARPPASAA